MLVCDHYRDLHAFILGAVTIEGKAAHDASCLTKAEGGPPSYSLIPDFHVRHSHLQLPCYPRRTKSSKDTLSQGKYLLIYDSLDFRLAS